MVGIIEAPSMPCSARKTIMLSMFQARPHNRLVTVKPAAEAANSQRVENTRVSQPLKRDHDDLGDQIGGLHPADLVLRRRQPAADVLQRRGDDLDVEQRHEAAEAHHHERQQALEPGGGVGHRRHSPDCAPGFVSTLTVVDRPGRSSPSRVAVVERDADRHALHDLGEVAGGVFRRDHAEDRPGARRQALDMAVEDLSRQHVGDDRRRLPRPHMRQLVLLEIGVDPEPLRRDDAQQIRAVRDIGTDLRGAVADIAVDRRADLGVAEIEAGGFEIGLGLGDVGAGFGDFRIEHAQLLPGGGEAGLRRIWWLTAPPGRLPIARSAFCRVPKVVSARSR